MAKAKKFDVNAIEPLVSRVSPENVRNTKAPDFKTVYTNNVAFSVSAFDISLVFGEIEGVSEGKILDVTQKVRVSMSPQHAKILATILVQNVQMYETKIGPIHLPQQLFDQAQQVLSEKAD